MKILEFLAAAQHENGNLDASQLPKRFGFFRDWWHVLRFEEVPLCHLLLRLNRQFLYSVPQSKLLNCGACLMISQLWGPIDQVTNHQSEVQWHHPKQLSQSSWYFLQRYHFCGGVSTTVSRNLHFEAGKIFGAALTSWHVLTEKTTHHGA